MYVTMFPCVTTMYVNEIGLLKKLYTVYCFNYDWILLCFILLVWMCIYDANVAVNEFMMQI